MAHASRSGPGLLPDWIEFSRLQDAALDIDPLYPVLRRALPDERRTWSAIVYVAYYNAASALTALERGPYDLLAGELNTLPTGVERRGLRGGDNLTRHLNSVWSYGQAYGSIKLWLRDGWTGDPKADWTATREAFGRAWGNGRWATYKFAEVAQKVLGWTIEPPDMGMDGATGPKRCLEMMYGDLGSVAGYEGVGRGLQAIALGSGVKLDLAEVETTLCDFHSLVEGRYYVGHDVALLHDQIAALPDGPARRALTEAAEAELPAGYWRPVQPALKALYRDTGTIAAV